MSKKNKRNEEREINLEESTPALDNPASAPPEAPAEEPSAESAQTPEEPKAPRVRYVATLTGLLPVNSVGEESVKKLKGEFPLIHLAAFALEKAGCAPTLEGIHIKSTMTRHKTHEIPEPGALLLLTMGPPETDEVVIFLNKKKEESLGLRTWNIIRVVKGVADQFDMVMDHRTLSDGRSLVGWVNVDVRNKDEVQE